MELIAPSEEQLGRNVKDVLPSEVAQRIIDCANRVRKKGEREEVEYSITISNEKRWYSAMLDMHQDGESIVQTVREITQRKAAEDELKNRENELAIYSSLLRHDLSNDLGVIFGNIDIARLVVSESEELIETLDSIEAICNRMQGLITVFSKPDDSTELKLIKQLNSVVATNNTVNPNLTINIHTQEAEENLSVPASRLMIMVWENLIRNAVEHAGESSIIDIEISREKNSILVLFSDNGPGVSEKVRKRLFQKGTTTVEGGLGLYLSREIIQSIGGTIELVTDESVEGAKFKIILPIVED
jgi:signal transduction histidine kinase